MRYNPPPNWPVPFDGWQPPSGWQPDPAWGPAPAGWQTWVQDTEWSSINRRISVLWIPGAVLLAVVLIAIAARIGWGG